MKTQVPKPKGKARGEEDDEMTGSSSYKAFKTAHETDPENVELYAPKAPVLDSLDDLEPLGRVTMFIEEGYGTFLVQPSLENQWKLFDLDNIVALESK